MISQGDIIVIAKEAVITALMISAPFLAVSLVIGLIISIFQAATQIHDQNIVFVPKIIATSLLMVFLGSWLISVMVGFTQKIFEFINAMV